jgi:hypothetical protein
MKIKFVTLCALALAICAAGCGSLPVSSGGTSNGSNLLSQNYSGALSPAEQLVVGLFQLEGSRLAVSAQQASQLLPLWEAYHTLITSNTTAQAELDSTLSQIEGTLTTQQLQAIAAMKLTSADRSLLQGQQLIETSTVSKSSVSAAASGAGGTGFPGPAGGDIVGLGSAPVVATATARAKTAGQTSAASQALVSALIRLLRSKVNS